jgi:D-arabinono-1,4-lactone oxidase
MVRFAAGDDAYLSPEYGRDTCYINVHQVRGMEYESYFRAAEAIFDDYGGRPHWGKRHYQTAATLGERYPEWVASSKCGSGSTRPASSRTTTCVERSGRSVR